MTQAGRWKAGILSGISLHESQMTPNLPRLAALSFFSGGNFNQHPIDAASIIKPIMEWPFTPWSLWVTLMSASNGSQFDEGPPHGHIIRAYYKFLPAQALICHHPTYDPTIIN